MFITISKKDWKVVGGDVFADRLVKGEYELLIYDEKPLVYETSGYAGG